ncbi:MAG: hypothetical protein A3E80_02900 [Chlamydiae bacterium RIFCSPHIGHO2_12_FULL_49_9]|nr:MAG: hypothetical protein A3E80_02900 [Chlamydiae bacterium RIFCSPHIGHO2_12_FULL_49_9]
MENYQEAGIFFAQSAALSTSLFPYEIIQWLLIIQFSIIGVHTIAALVSTPLSSFFSKRREQKLAIFKKNLLICAREKTECSLARVPPRLRKIPFLIPIMLQIDGEIKDPNWDRIKKSIFQNVLFPIAQKLTYSRKWAERIQAVGCFLYLSDKQNEKYILHLLGDSIPIVQYSAAYCAAKLGTSECVNAIINEMNRSNRFLRHPFREALLKGDDSSFEFLEARLEQDADPVARLSCLEVLSHHMNAHIADLAERDLHAPSKNLRIAAIRALGHYFDPKSHRPLIDLLKDPEWEIRAIAARALGYLKAQEALSELSSLLKDPVWWVRMNGALALKRLGEEGIKKLQQRQENQSADEIARYVLTLNIYE